MRFIGLLLTLVILSYVIHIYLKSSSVPLSSEEADKTHPQQAIERAEQAAEQFKGVLQQQQQRQDDSGN